MMAAISITEGISLTSLLQGFSPVSPGDDLEVTGLAIDSRTVQASDLFIAYPKVPIRPQSQPADDNACANI